MPTSKLTLSMRKETIDRAKDYARKNGSSLSAIIEEYLKALTADNKQDAEDLSPIVKSLRGILVLEDGFDYKKTLADAIEEKHNK